MSDTAARITNALAERYLLERELGQGGMATVFLAQDVKHDRKVAFKVLRPELAAVIGAERFLQEIKVTANLQHPHILPLHDSGDADGFLFYVMPYIEGEALRDLLKREKQLGIEEALEITKSIAAALDYAHRQGVIHRDIKPENILMHDGQALVADFGIALAVSQASGTRLTETGLSIGTPHYMSPEQAMGDRELDARSDVYSLGAVLYEMLTGDPPYTGSTAQAIVAKVITEKAPPVTALRDTVPAHVGAAIGKALSKMPADRFRSAADFASALSNPNFVTPTAVTSAGPASGVAVAEQPLWRRMAWPAATVALAGLAAFGLLRSEPPAPGRAARFLVLTGEYPVGSSTGGRLLTVSPDGSQIVYVGSVEGQQQLLLRRAADLEVHPIPDTEDGRDPTFSPDGEWLAFTKGSDIKRVRTSGGAALTVARGVYGGGAGIHWGESGDIVFTMGSDRLGIVPGTGGDVRTVAPADSLVGQLIWPHFLPDGRAVLVTDFPSLNAARIVMMTVNTGAIEVIVDEGVFPQYVNTGHIVYGHGSGSVFAVPFDVAARRATGQPTALLEGVQVFSGGATQWAASDAGTVVYLQGERAAEVPTLVDASRQEEPLQVPAGGYGSPRFSPDGRRIAVEVEATDAVEIRVYDRAAATLTLLSTEGGVNRYPLWDARGEWIVYSHNSEESQGSDVVRRRADGSGGPEVLYTAPGDQYAEAVTRDGTLLVRDNADESGRDLLVVIPGDSIAAPFLRNAWNEHGARLSPDERWVAYVSNESGGAEVYVTSFPVPSGKTQISRSGGFSPVWSSGGREIYYRLPDRQVMVASLRTDPALAVTDRRLVFDGRRFASGSWHAQYDVHPDGSQFIFIAAPDSGTLQGITVVVNWFAELRELMGERDRR
ncbi:MAG TPA: protein kinase [Gemmatimonadales bacterium]|jgi:serine/threonine-protein kinase